MQISEVINNNHIAVWLLWYCFRLYCAVIILYWLAMQYKSVVLYTLNYLHFRSLKRLALFLFWLFLLVVNRYTIYWFYDNAHVLWLAVDKELYMYLIKWKKGICNRICIALLCQMFRYVPLLLPPLLWGNYSIVLIINCYNLGYSCWMQYM